MKKILITGGAGFIASELVRQCCADGARPIVVDVLNYAGCLERIRPVLKKVSFYKVDIADAGSLEKVFKKEKPDGVIHCAAQTHVDRSIHDAHPFLLSNVIGTQNLIDLSRKYNVQRFLHVSTDEVYGQSDTGLFREIDPLRPRNPYSASKAAAEHLVQAAIQTHAFPAMIVRPSNNYGPWQFPEKFLPVIMSRALRGLLVPVYGKGLQIREWLFVEDCARAFRVVFRKGRIGEIYNIGSHFEGRNIDTVKLVLKALGRPESLIQFVPDRPAHDFRYSVDWAKLKRLGWTPKVTFAQGIERTVAWYQVNRHWVDEKVQT